MSAFAAYLSALVKSYGAEIDAFSVNNSTAAQKSLVNSLDTVLADFELGKNQDVEWVLKWSATSNIETDEQFDDQCDRLLKNFRQVVGRGTYFVSKSSEKKTMTIRLPFQDAIAEHAYYDRIKQVVNTDEVKLAASDGVEGINHAEIIFCAGSSADYVDRVKQVAQVFGLPINHHQGKCLQIVQK